MRYHVDGHEFDSLDSDLMSDGPWGPFHIFDIEAQKYLCDGFGVILKLYDRGNAEAIAAILNKEVPV
jgi:hypothetical protein